MIRRALSNLVIVALLAAWGYSAWQTHGLRMQVRALQSENRAARAQNARLAQRQTRSDAPPSWLARADAHLARAGEALSRADVGRAQREMAAGAADMQRAARAPAEQTQTALVRARAQITRVDERLKTLQAQMQELSAKTAPQIGLLRVQAAKLQAQAHALWRAGQREPISP